MQGYSTWSVCLSTTILAVQATNQPMKQANKLMSKSLPSVVFTHSMHMWDTGIQSSIASNSDSALCTCVHYCALSQMSFPFVPLSGVKETPIACIKVELMFVNTETLQDDKNNKYFNSRLYLWPLYQDLVWGWL